VTLGDPTGIGPELVAAALAVDAKGLVVFGDRAVIERAALAMRVELPPFELVEVTTLGACDPGRPTVETGRAQVDYVERAIAEAAAGRLDALVTAPIHKASAMAAGLGFPGHTELLAARFGVPQVTMLLAGPRLRVSLATIHLRLADVPRALTVDGLITTIVQTAHFVSKNRDGLTRLAVCGLNPHAGESGHFGDEEARIVQPALERARRQLPATVELSGPHVPDAVFRQHLDGSYHAVVALYHDQGLIPVKLIDFDEAVNVTLGLPIVRTSPDHGVAHDIAGTGRARTTSFAAALTLARRS